MGNSSNEEFVKGIFNLDNGKRLVMMLELSKIICLEDIRGFLH
ncbi:hypothetical protein [Lutispora thermophila]|uniref:Uncharacterized protein n=1 Tax=Lutispora thermophila DSM 19022 TaxID=1122184 RepID=A0A1M6EJ30_9FIRM|nr:hypothetical protein [Lutispora thermophila]SHI85522.1 hypothetical protein SAMN02745176_01593 [Lutispora thermophila DSM 19022]